MKFQNILLLFFLAGITWTSCDRVDEPLTVNVFDIPVITDSVFVVDSVVVDQKQVLLEDFTGHLCVNCPEAAITAHEWAENYDHKLIICTIHAGFYSAAGNEPYTYDFTCPIGTEIFDYFNQPSNPAGTINRVEFNGSQIVYFLSGGTAWAEAIASEMAKPNAIDMKVLNTYYPNKNSVKVNIASTVNQPLEGTYKIVVLILEDLIVRPQKNNDEEFGPVPDWLDYHHRNILRDGLTTRAGINVSTDGSLVQGETYFNQFYYELDKAWVSDTAGYNIISYIYNEANDNVIQVAELAIKMEE